MRFLDSRQTQPVRSAKGKCECSSVKSWLWKPREDVNKNVKRHVRGHLTRRKPKRGHTLPRRPPRRTSLVWLGPSALNVLTFDLSLSTPFHLFSPMHRRRCLQPIHPRVRTDSRGRATATARRSCPQACRASKPRDRAAHGLWHKPTDGGANGVALIAAPRRCPSVLTFISVLTCVKLLLSFLSCACCHVDRSVRQWRVRETESVVKFCQHRSVNPRKQVFWRNHPPQPKHTPCRQWTSFPRSR